MMSWSICPIFNVPKTNHQKAIRNATTNGRNKHEIHRKSTYLLALLAVILKVKRLSKTYSYFRIDWFQLQWQMG